MAFLDIGMLMTGIPDVSFTVSSPVTGLSTNIIVAMFTDPTVQGEIDKEVASLEEDLSELEVYPVAVFGLGFRF